LADNIVIQIAVIWQKTGKKLQKLQAGVKKILSFKIIGRPKVVGGWAVG
jgi:hypothetical protein